MSKTKEKSLWGYLKRGMQKYWSASRHEDMLDKGVPDVSYSLNKINGWIELKTIGDWPKRPTTLVKIHHFKDEQRHFIATRGFHGDHCYMLLRVGRSEHLLFSWKTIHLVGKLNKEELINSADYYSKKGIDFEAFKNVIGGKN